nr:serine/threonine-protein kinase srpk [Quercus suber]
MAGRQDAGGTARASLTMGTSIRATTSFKLRLGTNDYNRGALCIVMWMRSCLRIPRGLNCVQTARTTARKSSTTTIKTASTFERIDVTSLVEEERLRDYKAEHYYPVKIGQVFQCRYEVVGKLGFGTASTVWLCRDVTKQNEYRALKVYVHNSKVQREIPIYQHINGLRSEHEGRDRVRKLLDTFEIEGPHGKHVCLVQQPLGMSFAELRSVTSSGNFDVDLIRQTLRHIIVGLQFLHEEAHVIHTGELDLQPSNMLVGVHDNSAFAKFEQYEAESPSPRKELEDRTIYCSRAMPLTYGVPCISDLSEARFGQTDSAHDDLIMPHLYRAPEVMLKMPWSYPVDIWNFAMVVSLPMPPVEQREMPFDNSLAMGSLRAATTLQREGS